MSCADDLTVDDLTTSVTTDVLERVSAGEGANANLWAFIDRDNVVGLNLVQPGDAPKVIKTWDERLDEEEFVESGVDDEVGWVGAGRVIAHTRRCRAPLAALANTRAR